MSLPCSRLNEGAKLATLPVNAPPDDAIETVEIHVERAMANGGNSYTRPGNQWHNISPRSHSIRLCDGVSLSCVDSVR